MPGEGDEAGQRPVSTILPLVIFVGVAIRRREEGARQWRNWGGGGDTPACRSQGLVARLLAGQGCRLAAREGEGSHASSLVGVAGSTLARGKGRRACISARRLGHNYSGAGLSSC